jgi:hypothetical protein
VRELSDKLSDYVQHYEEELIHKDEVIAELSDQLSALESKRSRDGGLGQKAFGEMYNRNGSSESATFMELQHSHTQEVNDLRNQVSKKTQEYHRLQL